MLSHQQRRLEELFSRALDEPPQRRRAFIERACGSDLALKAELESLLAADRSATRFMDESPIESMAGHRDRQQLDTRRIGEQLGAYRLVRRIGSGGMGTVYEAEQRSPRRTVALKILSTGLTNSRALRRFEYESRILGRLRHRGIAQVYESAAGGDQPASAPYFAMEYIDGSESVRHYADRVGLDTKARLALLAEICQAVHHAHQQGIIHRDLKPANILVAPDGQPKVIDFGVARVTGSDGERITVRTDPGQWIGTMPYMSPEQITGGDPVDVRCDVYALGVIGYQLVCGALPFDLARASIPEAARIITESEPKRLGSHDRRLRGDLETIFKKALHKDRTRRYQSAHDLAGDIERYLADQPISARPPTVGYQFRKFARRNRGLVAGMTVALLGLVVGLFAATWQAIEARSGRLRAETQARTAARVTGFLRSILARANPKTGGRDMTVRDVLDQSAGRIEQELAGEPRVAAAVNVTIGDTYLAIGDTHAAAAYMQRAWRQYAAMGGELDPEALCALDQWLEILILTGAYDRVEALASHYADRLEDDPDRVSARAALLVNYGRALFAQGQLDGAGSAFRHAVALLDAEGGDAVGAELLPNALERWSDQQAVCGDLTGAEASMRRVVGLRVAHWGEQNVRTAWARIYLGAVLTQQPGPARQAEAERLTRRAIMDLTSLFGPQSHDVGVATSYLGAVLRNSGRLAEAEQAYRRSLAIKEKVLGPDHFDVAFSLYNLGTLLADQSRWAEAAEMLERAVVIRRELFSPTEVERVHAVEALAGVYCATGDVAKAEKLFSDRLAALGDLDDASPQVQRVRSQLDHLCAPASLACHDER